VTEAEYADLLEYVRRAMREHGLGEFDARLASEVYADAEERHGRMPPSTLLLRYLELLASRLQLQAAETAGGVLGELNEVARTERGGPIEGVELQLTENDRTLFAVDANAVDLVALPSLADLVEDLLALRARLAEEREGQG
jgi:hypothetical protein